MMSGINPTLSSPAPRRRKPCLRWGCVALISLLILCAIAVVVLRYYIRSSLTPEQWTQAQAMETKVITLPEEWQKPASLPTPEVVAFWDLFEEKSTDIREAHSALLMGTHDALSTASLFEQMRSDGPPVLPEQQTSYTLLLADLQPLIDETSRTVTQPYYTVELDLYTTGMVNFLNIQTFAKLAAIVARQYAAEGDYVRAIETAALPIRLIKRSEQANAITQLIAVAVTAISSNALHSIADTCTDTLALEQGIIIMDSLRDTAFPGNHNLWKYGDSIGALRFAAANGYPVNLSPQTMASYYRQSYWLYKPRYYHWIIDNLPAADRRVAIATARIEQIREWEDSQWSKDLEKNQKGLITHNRTLNRLVALVLGVDPYALLYASVSLNLKEMETRTMVAIAMFDLTRLRYAQRLAELNGLPAPTAVKDPFTSSPLPFSASREIFYSVGPDKKDDKIELLYDATNGTISPGDLIVD